MIKLSQVHKDLKGKEILHDVSIEAKKGRAYLLKGHNGSGKTMILRMLCGLIKPNKGKVVKDKDYSFGVMIESPSFLEGETALYNLKYLASINNRISLTDIEKALKKVNLYNYRNDKVSTFSLGMKQRLGICQAIMEEPDILLLDEPFNALDDENYNMAIELLMGFKKREKIIVVASHGFSVDKTTLFDEIITLSNGTVKKIEKVR
ncbi:ABC transporter ATP-binding protein [Proteinivorax tanatarense]|uniref:ABC transporter ATP-binding protein n=1 Tax=Proteinivorax tanatarense TaxID=1260629 RepID=A0AAU7VJU7_9FIRM